MVQQVDKGAIVLDYIHNLVAAVWIGGIILFCICTTSNIFTIKRIKQRKDEFGTDSQILNCIYHSVGIVIITGPTSDVVLRK